MFLTKNNINIFLSFSLFLNFFLNFFRSRAKPFIVYCLLLLLLLVVQFVQNVAGEFFNKNSECTR